MEHDNEAVFRTTIPVVLSVEEAKMLLEWMNPRHSDSKDVAQVKARISSAAKSSLSLLSSEANWANRDEDDNLVREILSDVWVRSKAIGEFRLAQMEGKLGMYVHVVREEALKVVIKPRDFIFEINGADCRPESLLEGLEGFLKGKRLTVRLNRAQEILDFSFG